MLTLNIESYTVSEHLLVVRGDACESLFVCAFVGNQNVVTLNCERPVGVSELSGGHFSRHPALPSAHIDKRSAEVINTLPSRTYCHLLIQEYLILYQVGLSYD